MICIFNQAIIAMNYLLITMLLFYNFYGWNVAFATKQNIKNKNESRCSLWIRMKEIGEARLIG